jgi:hypothetical protein
MLAALKGASGHRVAVTMNCNEDGVPTGDPLSGFRIRFHMVTLSWCNVQDALYLQLKSDIDFLNAQPDHMFDNFFNAIAPYLENFRGGQPANQNLKRFIMQGLRTHILESLLTRGRTELIFEGQSGPHMSFRWHGQAFESVVDNAGLGPCAHSICSSTRNCCSHGYIPICMAFVHCPP